MPQEPGTRPARAIPYELHVNGQLQATAQTYSLTFANTGAQGANFWVYSGNAAIAPRRYTVEAGKQLTDTWPLQSGQYFLSVYGPNGYFRRFAGNLAAEAATLPEVTTCYDVAGGNVYLTLHNSGATTLYYTVADEAYGQAARNYAVGPQLSVEDSWNLSCSNSWYDLQVSTASNPAYQRRIAGHVETGLPSTSDPAATTPIVTAI